jgi:predicted NAD/FAD-binding protein
MPPLRRIWSSWNFKLGKNRNGELKSTVVYYMNLLQRIPGKIPYFVSLNDIADIDPEKTYARIEYEHPLFDEQTEAAQARLPELNEEGKIFFSGSYFRYGFHEDAYMSAVQAAEAISRRMA